VKTLNILLIEGFYTGSHQRWADDICELSAHHVKVMSLPGRHWKWRMHGAAITLAEQYLKDDYTADVIICSDMIDVALFKSYAARKIKNTPLLLYFHENQISLVEFLTQFPDHQNKQTIELIKNKSSVIPIGIRHFKNENENENENENQKIILWNHRWEYDKNPELFFSTLFQLKKEGKNFSLIVAGESTTKYPNIFDKAKDILASEIIHFGFAKNKETYIRLLESADIIPVTSNQDFFGISVIEAIACRTFPLLPDRLAYPDHIPEEYKSQVLYQHDEEFYVRLKSLLTNPIPQLNYEWIQKYSWDEVIQQYDRLFSEYR